MPASSRKRICWATAYQNHKEASFYPHGSVPILPLSFATCAFKALLKQRAIRCHHVEDWVPHSSHKTGSSLVTEMKACVSSRIHWLPASHWNQHVDRILGDGILDWMLAQEAALYLICKFKMATGTHFPQLQFISTKQLSSHAKKSEVSKVKQKCN